MEREKNKTASRFYPDNTKLSLQLLPSATMETGGSTPPSSVSNFSVLKHSEYYQDSAENVLLAQKFLLCGTTAYIYNKNTVLCVSGINKVIFSSLIYTD